MSNEDNPYIWIPEVCQFGDAAECLQVFPNSAAALVVSHLAYEEALRKIAIMEARASELESIVMATVKERDEARALVSDQKVQQLETSNLLTAARAQVLLMELNEDKEERND